jgi:hypothetical protein
LDVAYYSSPGPFTELTPTQIDAIAELTTDPIELCLTAQRLLVSPPDAVGAGVPEVRIAERNTRPARALLQRALEMDPATPLDHPRPVDRRVVGTCRHFAVLATAFLQATGTPARGRCGFATYFVPPKKVDHWIVEYWNESDERWIRIDPEYVGKVTPSESRPEDLRPGEFLTAGEAWQLIRSGQDQGTDFGVFGTENWGPGEVRGNAMRDLASIFRKIEMLPWDEWGPMQDSYDNKTGDDFDVLIDDLAVATIEEDDAEMHRIYEHLAVPAAMVQ